MLTCETWLANDFLIRRGYKPGPCCGHDPDACPPHREEKPMPDPTTLAEWVEHCRAATTNRQEPTR